MDQLIGQSIDSRLIPEAHQGRYRIRSLLGKQTGRRTYLATDSQNNQSVVIKLVLFGPDFTWQDLRLFEREAETLKSLDHPAIPSYLDSFEVDTALGKGFALVQTYIAAKSLREVVAAGRTFSQQDLIAIARQILQILNYLHSRYPPVIHRDIKPSNILITEQPDGQREELYLVDFGSVQTAPSNGTMTIVGTYGYMPIEQFSGRALPASDLYSLGATLIFLATGKHPAEIVRPNLTLDFEQFVQFTPAFTHWIKQLICVDLENRTASARQALDALAEGSPTPSPLSRETLPNIGKHPYSVASLSDRSSVLALSSVYKDIEVYADHQALSIRLCQSRLVDLTTDRTLQPHSHGRSGTFSFGLFAVIVMLFYPSLLILILLISSIVFLVGQIAGSVDGVKASQKVTIDLYFPCAASAMMSIASPTYKIAGTDQNRTSGSLVSIEKGRFGNYLL